MKIEGNWMKSHMFDIYEPPASSSDRPQLSPGPGFQRGHRRVDDLIPTGTLVAGRRSQK